MPDTIKAVPLFFSYSHADESFRDTLEKHLSLLKRQGVIESWHDRRIPAGHNIDDAISENLDQARIILLLVSADFIASDYCYEREMKRALEKHADGTAVVIPVILRPCDWHTAPFGKFRASPTDGKPISTHANLDEAFAIVTKDVREAVSGLGKSRQPKAGQARAGQQSPPGPRSSNLRVKRRFTDQQRDEFLESTFDFIANYFAESLKELSTRNPHIKGQVKKLDARAFAAFIYDDGEKVAQCQIFYGGQFFEDGIAYSHSADGSRNSFNETMTVTDDGYNLQLKPLGMSSFSSSQEALSPQGAAEFYWSLFIKALQD